MTLNTVYRLVLCVGLVMAPAGAHAQLLGPLSEEEEVAVGRAAADEIEKGLELLSDDLVTSYISDLGQAVAAESARRSLTYRFTVVNTSEINAFALPANHCDRTLELLSGRLHLRQSRTDRGGRQ